MLNKPTYFAFSLLIFAILYSSACLPVAAQAREMEGQYRVRVSETHPLRASVEAQIPVKDGRLFMAPWGADFLPDGWMTFVHNLRVGDESNRQLSFEPRPNGVRQISSGFNGRANLSYEVDLSFTKAKWKYGNEQAGSFQDDALFVVSKALFIVSDTAGQRRLSFDLPASWIISAPWQSPSANPRTFVAEDNDDLINNSVVMGRHAEYKFNEGNFTLILALVGPMEKSKDLVAPALQRVVRSYARIFDKTPPGKYLMTIFYADEADAEAFARSSAFTEHDALTKENLIRWGNTVAHEFFHAWNGHAIRGEDYAASQWFAEGFTEYFANLTLVREGLISKELFIKKMENNLGLYLYFKVAPAFEGVSLKEAGSKKGRHRLGVYDGGWATAFCLDVMMRDETQGRKGLEDFMRLMYEKFGLTSRKYRYEDLVETAGETIGRDLGDFFKKYVEGNELLPVKDCLKRAGFNGYTQLYDGEIYIFESPTADQREVAIRRALLTRR